MVAWSVLTMYITLTLFPELYLSWTETPYSLNSNSLFPPPRHTISPYLYELTTVRIPFWNYFKKSFVMVAYFSNMCIYHNLSHFLLIGILVPRFSMPPVISSSTCKHPLYSFLFADTVDSLKWYCCSIDILIFMLCKIPNVSEVR